MGCFFDNNEGCDKMKKKTNTTSIPCIIDYKITTNWSLTSLN